MRLTGPQREALRACRDYGQLWQTQNNHWKWYVRHPQGYVRRIATNPTVLVLKSGGFVSSDVEKSVKITDAGRAALAQSVEKK